MTIPTDTHDDIMRDLLSDPGSQEEWDRNTFSRAVANQVIAFRMSQNLSQSALARKIGVSQPVVARLELGEHEPTVSTLRKLARTLGMRFSIDIHPAGMAPDGFPEIDERAERVSADGVEMLIIATG